MESNVITGRIPYPPSINRYYITKSKKCHLTGRMIKHVTRTQKVKKYVEDVGYLLLQQRCTKMHGERLRLELYLYPPDNRRRDLDNICKSTLDALQYANLFRDDFYIQQLYVERKEVRKHGEIEFVLIEL